MLRLGKKKILKELGKFINHTLIPNARNANIRLKDIQIRENKSKTEL